MKKIILCGVALSLSVSLMGCTVKENKNSSVGEVETKIEQQIDKNQLEKEEITNVVEGFGKKLRGVSLLAPKDVLEKEMEENYGEFVSKELMEKWQMDPENAPGKLVSSPWPDRIEIENIEKLSEDEYKVEGKVVEITSDKNDKGISRSITLNIRKMEDKWLIDDVILGEYVDKLP